MPTDQGLLTRYTGKLTKALSEEAGFALRQTFLDDPGKYYAHRGKQRCQS